MAILSPIALKMMRLLTNEVFLSVFEAVAKNDSITDVQLRNFFKDAGIIQLSKLHPTLKQLVKYGLINGEEAGEDEYTINFYYKITHKGKEIIKHLEELVKYDNE